MPDPLRIAIVSTPRSGNTWLRRLLQAMYGIPEVAVHRLADDDWARLPAEVALQLHWPRTPEFVEQLSKHGFRVLSLARHPLDVLISILHFSWYELETDKWLQGEGGDETWLRAAMPRSRTFVDYCTGPRAAALLNVTADWWGRPGGLSVRYEDAVADPMAVCARLFEHFGPPRCPDLHAAVEACSLAPFRRGNQNNHFWKGQPGLWRELLPAIEANEILTAVRPACERLGYAADPDPAVTAGTADAAWVRYTGQELVDTVRGTLDGFRADVSRLTAERDAARQTAAAFLQPPRSLAEYVADGPPTGRERKAFLSYAQNAEDVPLWRVFGEQAEGFYVDVGASSPDESVTRAFSLAGWTGLNLEPLPELFAQVCAARPRDINLAVAASDRRGTATLFSAVGGLSTLEAGQSDRLNTDGHATTPVEVPLVPLADLFAEHVTRTIDFLKVDVEGHERQVLAGNDWARWRPRVVLVEATEPNSRTPNYHGWEPILLDADYHFALFDGLNRFYVRGEDRDMLDRLGVPANYFDDYQGYAHHTALARLDEATASAADLGERFHQLSGEFHTLSTAHHTLSQQHHALNEQTHTLAGTHRELGAAHDALSRSHHELNQRHDALSRRHHELNQLHDALSRSHADLHQRHDTLGRSHHELNQLHDTLSRRHHELNQQHHELNAKLTALTREHQRAVAESADRLAQLEDARRQLATLQEHHHTLSQHHHTLSQRHHEVSTHNEERRKQLELLTADHRRYSGWLGPFWWVCGRVMAVVGVFRKPRA